MPRLSNIFAHSHNLGFNSHLDREHLPPPLGENSFASRNHQSTNKTTQCSDSNKNQKSPIPPTVEDIAGYDYKKILP